MRFLCLYAYDQKFIQVQIAKVTVTGTVTGNYDGLLVIMIE